MEITQERNKWFEGIDDFAMEMKKQVGDKINSVVEDCMLRIQEKNSNILAEDEQSKPEKEAELTELIELKVSELFGEGELGVALTCFKLWDMKRKEKKEDE